MVWNISRSQAKSQMQSYTNSAAGSRQFSEGLISHPIFELVQFKPFANMQRFRVFIEDRYEEIATNSPEGYFCGVDSPSVGEMIQGTPREILPFEIALNMDLCINNQSTPKTYQEALAALVRKQGYGYGKKFGEIFWRGFGSNSPGILGLDETLLLDFAGTQYADLSLLSSDDLSIFFNSQLSSGMDDPVFLMGPVTHEVIFKGQLGVDTCLTKWQCFLQHMALKLGESVAQVESRFRANYTGLDYVFGIDPLNPNDPLATIMAIDRGQLEMGGGNVRWLEPDNEKLDTVYTKSILPMTSPIVMREDGIRLAYNIVPQAKIDDAVGIRYGNKPIPNIDLRG